MKNIETNKYFAIMSEKDDVELMRIITVERADYQADAVIAAEEELERREISPSMYQDFTEEVEKLIKVEIEKKVEKQHLPLSTWVKVMAFIFPFPLFFIIGLVLILFDYQIRGNELCKWIFFGWVFYFTLLVIMKIFL